MLKLSKKVDYGLILLSKLTQQDEASSAREMAARYRLPPSMVANILKELTGRGILTSTRGAQGGYELARPASRISLAEIVEALEGRFSLVDCVDDECRYAQVCPTHDPIQVVHERFHAFMSQLTLAEVVGEPQVPNPIRTDGNDEAHLSR